MNNNGDKIEGIQPPKVEQKNESPKQEKQKQAPPVTQAAQEQKVQTPPARPNSNFSRTLEETRKSSEQKVGDRVKLNLTEYVLLLQKAKNPKEVATAQMKFYAIIKEILLKKDFAIFNRDWNSLLNFINSNKEHINLISINRSVYLWPLSPKDQQVFSKIALLAVLSADPSTRRKPAGVEGDSVMSLAEKLGREAANNLGAFYNFD